MSIEPIFLITKNLWKNDPFWQNYHSLTNFSSISISYTFSYTSIYLNLDTYSVWIVSYIKNRKFSIQYVNLNHVVFETLNNKIEGPVCFNILSIISLYPIFDMISFMSFGISLFATYYIQIQRLKLGMRIYWYLHDLATIRTIWTLEWPKKKMTF
jgi:hypothetical protein